MFLARLLLPQLVKRLFFPSKFSIRKASPCIASENNYRISSCYFLGDPFWPREILREAYAKDMHGNYTT